MPRKKDELKPRKDGRKWVKENLAISQQEKNSTWENPKFIFALYDSSTFEGPIDEVIERLTVVKNYYEDRGYRRVALDIAIDFEDGINIGIHGYRLETKEECQKRVEKSKRASFAAKKRERKKKKEKEEQERREYERLRKKYDNA
jgi:hypothetical protein